MHATKTEDVSLGNSSAVQLLGLRALSAEGLGSIPGQGTKIPLASGCGQTVLPAPPAKKKKIQNKNKQKEDMCLTRGEAQFSHLEQSLCFVFLIANAEK